MLNKFAGFYCTQDELAANELYGKVVLVFLAVLAVSYLWFSIRSFKKVQKTSTGNKALRIFMLTFGAIILFFIAFALAFAAMPNWCGNA